MKARLLSDWWRTKAQGTTSLTVGAGLKLETGAAGSVAGGGASSDLQQVRRVGLQAAEGHVAAAGSEDGVAGLLLLLPEAVTSPRGRLGFLVFMHVHGRKHYPPPRPALNTPASLIN